MHRRLERQIKKTFTYLGDQTDVPSTIDGIFEGVNEAAELKGPLKAFINKVDLSYRQYERDITLRQESLRRGSNELIELNERLRHEAKQQGELIAAIRASVNRLLVARGDREITADQLSAERISKVLVEIFDELESAQVELQHQKEALDHHAIVTVADARGYITYANSNFCDISGYSQNHLIGLNQRELKANKEVRRQYESIWARVHNGEVWHGELEERTKDGEFYWVTTTIVPIRDKNDAIHQFITIQTDLSPRKKVEATLEKERRFLNSITDTMGEGVYTLDAKGLCTFFNKEAERVMGYKRNDVIGKDLLSLIKARDESGNPLAANDHELWRKNRAGKPYRSENLRFTTRNKLNFYASLYSVPMMDQNREIGMVGVFQNITQRLNTQRVLSRAKAAAEEANKQKSQFLANMSHEIRTPLNAIIGLSHIAMSNESNTKKRHQLGKIHSSSNALLEIINDILDFSKIEAGQLLVERIEFNIDEVIEKVANVTSFNAESKGIELFITRDSNLPIALIGDPLRISQILLNLTNNAIKFTPEGRVTVKIAFVTLGEDAIELTIEVQDTGIGMSANQVNALFQPFFQGDSGTTRKFGGTGLGLSISQRLAKLMGGVITVESAQNEGSTFTLKVPLSIAASNFDRNQSGPLRGKTGLLISDISDDIVLQSLQMFGLAVYQEGVQACIDRPVPADIYFVHLDERQSNHLRLTKTIATNIIDKPIIVISGQIEDQDIADAIVNYQRLSLISPPLNPSKLWDTLISVTEHDQIEMKSYISPEEANKILSGNCVLLVEDNEINQEVAREMLMNIGLTVVIAGNGVEALAKIKAHAIDLVLMDVQMPIMDGYEATQKIRSQKEFDKIPIIALTAHATKEDYEKSLGVGMDGHLTKPIDPSELPKTLTNHLTVKRSNTASFEKTPEPQLPKSLSGFDVETSLKRINGNKKLYLKLLSQFVTEYGVIDYSIIEFVNNGRLDKAQEEVHRLKGVSGTLGADVLYSSCVQLEKQIKTGSLGSDDLSNFSNTLNDTLITLNEHQLVPPSEFEAREQIELRNPDLSDLQLLAQDSIDLLARGDTKVLTLLDEWHQQLYQTKYQHTGVILANQVNNFDFTAATKTITDMMSTLEVET